MNETKSSEASKVELVTVDESIFEVAGVPEVRLTRQVVDFFNDKQDTEIFSRTFAGRLMSALRTLPALPGKHDDNFFTFRQSFVGSFRYDLMGSWIRFQKNFVVMYRDGFFVVDFDAEIG